MPSHKVTKYYTIIDDDSISTTQDSTLIRTGVNTSRRTFVGGHIDITVTNDNSATNSGLAGLALVREKDNVTLPNMTLSDGGAWIEPHEAVLWGTILYMDEAIDTVLRVRERLEANRILFPGDELRFLFEAEVAGMSASLGGLLIAFVLD